MQRIGIRTGYACPTLPADDDADLVMPVGPRTGGLNLVGVGRSLTVNGGQLGDQRINATGAFDNLILKGLKGDFSATPSDGLDLGCRARRVGIDGCRLTGINGRHAAFHGDGLQVQLGARIDLLTVTNTTICSAYQGIMTWARQDGTGVKVLYLDRVNIRDEPKLRTEPSIALYLGDRAPDGNKTAPYTIILGDVWVDWPDPAKIMFLPAGATVVGSIRPGVPPGGDFCP